MTAYQKVMIKETWKWINNFALIFTPITILFLLNQKDFYPFLIKNHIPIIVVYWTVPFWFYWIYKKIKQYLINYRKYIEEKVYLETVVRRNHQDYKK